MKSTWTILTLVGALAMCSLQATLAQSPAAAATSDDDSYSSHVGDLGASATQTEASSTRDASRSTSTGPNAPDPVPSDPTTFAVRLDDRATHPESAPAATSSTPADTFPYETVVAASRQENPEHDHGGWQLPVPDPGDPTDRFASLANLLFTSGERDSKGMMDCGSKCEPCCDCPSCRRCEIFDRTFASFEYQHFWSKPRSVPPLVTTDNPATPLNSGPPDFTPIGLTLNSPTGQLLLGNENIGGDRQSAGRLTVGWWLDDGGSRAVAFRTYGSEGAAFLRNYDSNSTTPLGRPFFNSDPLVNAQDALVVAHPALNRPGSIGVRGDNEFLGADAYFRTLVDSGHNYRVDLLGGYRFNRIDDDLLITTHINASGLLVDMVDLFDVSNQYHAGDLGVYGEWYHDCWTLSMMGKIGVGNMHERIAISGYNVINDSVTTAGGLLTQPTNIGVYKRDVLVWSPEANVKLAYAFTDRMSLTVGYTFMYWTRAATAGDQIDFNVNASQLTGGTLVGPPDPQFRFNDTDYWVQSVDIGFSWNY